MHWAIWAAPIAGWGRRAARLSITSKTWLSGANATTTEAKATCWATWAWLMRTWASPAIACYERALPLFHGLDHRAGQAAVLHNLGLAHTALGEPARAIEYGEQALPILRNLGDSAGMAETNRRLAQFYGQLGEHQRAAELRAGRHASPPTP